MVPIQKDVLVFCQVNAKNHDVEQHATKMR